MEIGESIRTSFEEIKGHPLRSGFTLFGVILGTLALVVVLTVMDGVASSVYQGLEDLGLDGVLIITQRAPADRVERARAYESRGLRKEDMKWFLDNDLVKAIAPVGESRAVITAGTLTRRVGIYGVTPEFAVIKNRRVSDGRFIVQSD